MQNDARQTPDHSLDVVGAPDDSETISRSWTPDGTGIVPGGTVGGEGAQESVSVRYANPHLPNAAITTYFYVVDLRVSDDMDTDRPFIAETMTEYFLADRPVADPQAQEVWFHEEHGDDAGAAAFATEAEALVERDRLAAQSVSASLRWDGRPH